MMVAERKCRNVGSSDTPPSPTDAPSQHSICICPGSRALPPRRSDEKRDPHVGSSDNSDKKGGRHEDVGTPSGEVL